MVINHKDSGLPLNRLFCTVQSNRGFTLVELVLVMGLIGVLSTIAFAEFGAIKNRVRTARCIEEIRGLEKEIIAYTTDKGTNPPDLDAVGWGTQLDPWGHVYEYHPVGSRKSGSDNINTDFDLYSNGVDGLSAASIIAAESLDDIIRANDGSFAGVADGFAVE